MMSSFRVSLRRHRQSGAHLVVCRQILDGGLGVSTMTWRTVPAEELRAGLILFSTDAAADVLEGGALGQ